MRRDGLPGAARGAVLLLALVALAGLAAALLWRLETAAERLQRERRAVGMAALAEAREALLGYALRDASRPGELPCPDYDRDGVIRIAGSQRDYRGSRCRSDVDGVVGPGWLPWRTLGLPPLRDGYGEPLWYVVDDAYHANGAVPLNSDTPGALTLDGVGEQVALLIAPGPVAAGEERPTAGFDALLHRERYLEGENGDGDLDYRRGDGGDLLLALDRNELMAPVEARVVAELAALLAAYRAACGVYPDAAPFGAPLVSVAGDREGRLPLDGATPYAWGAICPDGPAPRPPAWMAAWAPLLYYAFAVADCTAGVDCLWLTGDGAARSNVEAVALVAGADLSGARPSTRLGDYLEGENATPGDRHFERRHGDPAFNDRLRVVAP
ncbi:hypothetical protein [Endothiovibrio diazotrophicus]